MKAYCIVESRPSLHHSEWPIVFDGTLAQCQAALARAGEPTNDWTWHTTDGYRYTRAADLTERHICRAWWADGQEHDSHPAAPDAR